MSPDTYWKGQYSVSSRVPCVALHYTTMTSETESIVCKACTIVLRVLALHCYWLTWRYTGWFPAPFLTAYETKAAINNKTGVLCPSYHVCSISWLLAFPRCHACSLFNEVGAT